MLVAEYDAHRRATPIQYACFTVSRCPEWAKELVQEGDTVYWHPARHTLVVAANNTNVGLSASHLKFLGYRTHADLRKQWTDCITY